MNATLSNEIQQSRLDDVVLQAAIASARAGELPEGVVLAAVGDQELIREGQVVVSYKVDASGARIENRRTPIDANITTRLCDAFLARNNRS